MVMDDLDRLVRFAGQMLGQIKSARANAEAVCKIRKFESGTGMLQYEQHLVTFDRIIQQGEEALAPYRSELGALDPPTDWALQGFVRPEVMG